MANCFVIMPFRAELGFLYRAMRARIQQSYPDVTVERGDDRILTGTVLDKIASFIRQADVVIADCSGRNPNVFYELGMAHALGKPVILVTSDDVEEAPTDIRAFEFVSYAKLGPEEFLARLDKALEGIVGNPFSALYPEATALFAQFVAARQLADVAASQAEFETAMAAMQARGQRLPAAGRARAEYLVRRLLGAEPEIEVLIALKSWLDQAYP